jgi:hypothetical protein
MKKFITRRSFIQGLGATSGALVLGGGLVLPTAFAGGLEEEYTNAVYKELDIFATSEPLAPAMRLGDFGSMEKKEFVREGAVGRFGNITLQERKTSGGVLEFQTKGDVTVNSTLGAAGTGANGEVRINFAKKDAVFMRLEELEIVEVGNVARLEEFLIDVYKRNGKDWRLSNVVVTKRYLSRRFLIIVSRENDTRVTLSGKVSRAVTSVADINLKDLTISSKRGSMVVFDYMSPPSPADQKTPLIALHELKDSVFGSPKLVEYK